MKLGPAKQEIFAPLSRDHTASVRSLVQSDDYSTATHAEGTKVFWSFFSKKDYLLPATAAPG